VKPDRGAVALPVVAEPPEGAAALRQTVDITQDTEGCPAVECRCDLYL
jgi:hypothetical protein